MEQHKIWIEQFEAAEGIEDEFGTQKALEYLVGEKFLNFLEAAETEHANLRLAERMKEPNREDIGRSFFVIADTN